MLVANKNQADSKILVARENQADSKILAASENQADGKILAADENQADGKILADVEISAPGEIPASVEILSELEKQAARLLFRLGGISNCWLLPGPADEHILLLIDVMNLEHVVSKWGESSCRPAFMGGLSPVLYQLFVPARHAKKWSKSMRQPKVRLPPGIPLISVKTQHSLTLLTSVLSLNGKKRG
jgi:hypothetical protein